MKAWAFCEDEIGPALERWREEFGVLFPGDIDVMVSAARTFLYSAAARKLRVAELEGDAAASPAPGPEGVLGPLQNVAQVVLI